MQKNSVEDSPSQALGLTVYDLPDPLAAGQEDASRTRGGRWRMVMVIRHNSIVSPTPLPLERVCPPIIRAIDHMDAGKTGATFDVDCEYDLSTDGNNVTVTADHWPVSIMVDGIWLRQETIHHYGKGSMTQDGKKSLTVEVPHPVAQWYIEKLQSFVLEKAGIDSKII
jgi:hypothetical protein